MKRLLLGPALVIPLLTLGFCGKSPQLPKVVPEVVREIPLDTFEQRFPPITTMPTEPAPAPVVKPHQVKPHVYRRRDVPIARHAEQPARHVRPHAPQARPQAPEAPVETLPPQQGSICIFPLNFIPNCTPQETQ